MIEEMPSNRSWIEFMSRIKPGETIKECETIPKSSRKKRRVLPTEVDFKFKKGQHVDLKAVLSSKTRDFLVTTKGGEKVPIDSLKSKYVIVCCFLLPLSEDSVDLAICRSIEALYSELSRQHIEDQVKLVLVAKIAPGSRLANFDSFFSCLSVNCLAIPYSDFKSRDNLCDAFLLCPLTHPCIVVNPSGMVLQANYSFLRRYGAQSFPFTEKHFANINHQDEVTKSRIRCTDSPISIEELLQCDSVSLISDESKSISTSVLKHSLVGLYLCFDGFDGGFMIELQDIHQKCRERGLEFEIVIAPLPFGRDYDPHSFYNLLKTSALKNTTSSSWWVMPYNDKICRTLWRLFQCYREDELIILPHKHNGHLGDLRGRHMTTVYGIDAYPFTRDVIIQRKVDRLRSFTLAQLLGGDTGTHMLDVDNKNALLYFDYPFFEHDNGELYRTLYHSNHEIKVKYPDSVMVFIPLRPLLSARKRIINKTWPVLPPELCESVIKHIFLDDEGNRGGPIYPSLVAFGKDGKILSRSADERLPELTSSSSESLFDDTLASEFLAELMQEMTY